MQCPSDLPNPPIIHSFISVSLIPYSLSYLSYFIHCSYSFSPYLPSFILSLTISYNLSLFNVGFFSFYFRSSCHSSSTLFPPHTFLYSWATWLVKWHIFLAPPHSCTCLSSTWHMFLSCYFLLFCEAPGGNGWEGDDEKGLQEWKRCWECERVTTCKVRG